MAPKSTAPPAHKIRVTAHQYDDIEFLYKIGEKILRAFKELNTSLEQLDEADVTLSMGMRLRDKAQDALDDAWICFFESASESWYPSTFTELAATIIPVYDLFCQHFPRVRWSSIFRNRLETLQCLQQSFKEQGYEVSNAIPYIFILLMVFVYRCSTA
ncbi:hypothetical protein MPER_02207 [Moniliophthora perniciosa FA553]|nr:hypothetical protein MPER_02207 [Moniliophthora perniciosa FA553]